MTEFAAKLKKLSLKLPFMNRTPQPKPKSIASQIQSLNGTSTTYQKRIEHLEKKSLKYRDEARLKLQRKNKKAALMCLKRKKMVDMEINKMQQLQFNLDSMKFQLENASTNATMVHAMKTVKGGLKQFHSTVSVSEVEDTMDDISELMDDSNEMNDILGRPVGDCSDDEDALLGELDELEQEAIEEMFEGTIEEKDDSPVALPSVPNEVHTKDDDTDEEEEDVFKKLEAEMLA
jgi:hypothetical protein